MKNRTNMIVGAFVLAVLAAGCATTGYQRADRAVASMTGLRDELSQGKQQASQTIGTLNELVSAEEGDLRPAYKAFEKDVASLQRSAQSVQGWAGALAQNAATYFDAWGEQIETIQSEDLKLESTKRRSDAMQSYQGIEGPAGNAAAAYEPLLADLRDIQAHLGQDLTAKGTAGTRDFVAKATQDAATLEKKLDGLVAELDRVIAEINARAETGN